MTTAAVVACAHDDLLPARLVFLLAERVAPFPFQSGSAAHLG
jgi:hypothetical protein